MKVKEESTWLPDAGRNFPTLSQDITADVVIIGRGLTGILTAYFLSNTKKKVVLIDADEIGGKNAITTYTTAHVTEIIDTDYSQLVEMIGTENSKLVWKSHHDAIQTLADIIKKENISCEFKRIPAYKFTLLKKDFGTLEDEDSTLKQFGAKVRLHDQGNFGPLNEGALEISDQAEFNATEFISGMLPILKKRGVLLFNHTEAQEVVDQEGKVVVTTDKGAITAEYCVTATYWPLRRHRDLFGRKGEYISYVYEVHTAPGTFPEGLYWDLENPYHYIRVDRYKDYDRLIVGGEDHRVEIPIDKKKNYKALSRYIRQILQKVDFKPVRRWNSKVLEPSDGLAYIGKLTDRQLLATAFSGNGMTYAVIAGQLFSDLIIKKKNPYSEIYDPDRSLNLKALAQKGKDYTEELIGGAFKNVFQ